jgi:hypothetical protein
MDLFCSDECLTHTREPYEPPRVTHVGLPPIKGSIMRFSLRAMLTIVTAIALVLSPYPFVFFCGRTGQTIVPTSAGVNGRSQSACSAGIWQALALSKLRAALLAGGEHVACLWRLPRRHVGDTTRPLSRRCGRFANLFCLQDRTPPPDDRCGAWARRGLPLVPFWQAVQLAPTVAADSLHESLDAVDEPEDALLVLHGAERARRPNRRSAPRLHHLVSRVPAAN